MYSPKKITILIPCKDEEKGVGKVIDSIPFAELHTLGYEADVVVIDNGSTDGTGKVAENKHVSVIHEVKPGKGNAVKRGFLSVSPDTDYVVMLDGDNSYKAYEIPRMIEPLASDFCDVVIGSRLGGKLKKNSLRFSNRLANWAFTFLVRQIYRANVTDVLSGFFAWKREVIADLAPQLRTNGFAIEMEMITKMVRMKYEIYSVPITYDLREGESKLASVKDGMRILGTFLLNLFWKPDNTQRRKHTYRRDFQLKESV